MKCNQCKYDNPENSFFCRNCMAYLKEFPKTFPVTNYFMWQVYNLITNKITAEDFIKEVITGKEKLDTDKTEAEKMEPVDPKNEFCVRTVQLLKDAYTLFDQGAEHLLSYKDNPDLAILAEGLELMLLGNEFFLLLEKEYEMIKQVVPEPITCPQCGKENEKGTNICSHCNFKFPKVYDEEPSSTLVIDEDKPQGKPAFANYIKTREIAHDVMTGKRPDKDLECNINEMKKNLKSCRESLESFTIPDNTPQQDKDFYVNGRNASITAIDLYYKGLETCEKYFTSKDQEDIHLGLSQMEDSNDILAKIQLEALERLETTKV